MTAEVIHPLAAWLTALNKRDWKRLRGAIHHGDTPLNGAGFTVFPLGMLTNEFKRRPLTERQLHWQDFIDKDFGVEGYRVRIDLVAGYLADGDEIVHMFVAAETPWGHFVETMDEVEKIINETCIGQWCFHNKAFWFENQADALLINAYVFS